MSGQNGLSDSAVAANAKPIVKKTSGGGNKKGTSAERRATHNAVERARRESLNVRFLELAANLPATCTVRRPSKSLIVNKSLEFVDQALNVESVLRLKVEELLHENKGILEELNNLRQDKGMSPRSSTIDAGLPLPLAESDFKKMSQRANLALSRGSVSLDGDFDDDYSGQASNSSLSSSGSPPGGLRASSALGFQPSPKVSSSSHDSSQYYFDSSNTFPHSQQQQPVTAAFSLPAAYYSHDSISQQHSQHHQQSSDFITPINTASMFTQMMGAYSSSEEGGGNNNLSHLGSHHDPLLLHHHQNNHNGNNNHNSSNHMLGLDDNTQNSFAALASNTFFDHRYSNSASASTPTATSFTTTV